MWICQRAGSLFSEAITKNVFVYIPIRLNTNKNPHSMSFFSRRWT